MKKRLVFIISVCFLILLGIAFVVHQKSATHAIPTPTDVLAQSEIDRLREQYPINDADPPLGDTVLVSLEKWIGYCDCFVKVEVLEEPTEFIKTVTLAYDTPEGELHEKAGGSQQFEFVKCKVRILDDAFEHMEQGMMEVTYNSMFSVGMPVMEVGAKFIMGGMYNEKTGTIDIGSETMFYVTDEDYILSVKSEESVNRHTGTKVDDFFEYLKAVKAEAHTVKFDYTFANRTFPIHFVWSEGDGKLLAHKVEAEENSEKALRWSVYGDTEFVKIYLYPDGISDEYYLILYDVHEDELLDVLDGMPSEQKENINDVLLAEDLSSAIIHCNKNEDVYYYNIPKEELISLEELTGVEEQAFAVYLKEDLLLVNSRQGTHYANYNTEVYIYDINTQELRTIVERMPLYNANYQPEGIVLRGSENPWIYEDNKIYEVDLQTGERNVIDK